jgi:hypothetical protein
MSKRFPNPRAVKLHRSYTVGEIAKICAKHEKTVRSWIAEGLSPVDGGRPTLVCGRELRRFLDARRKSVRQPCKLDQMFCFRCRQPRIPMGLAVDLVSFGPGQSTLRGRCPICRGQIFRHVREGDIPLFNTKLDVRPSRAERNLNESSHPLPNTPLTQATETDANAPPKK